MVNQVDNFANIGKAVLLQSLGLQKNHSEYTESFVDVTDYNTAACASCKYCAIAKSFNPDSDIYKESVAACLSCPHRVTTTKKILKKIYHNEKNRYGYKPMLKSMAIKLLLLFHFYHPDRFGIVDNISYADCAGELNCTIRTIHNNLESLSSYGYISYSRKDSKHFSVCLSDYENYYLPASKGGRGYLVMSKDLFYQIVAIDNLMSLRIHLRQLAELDTLNIKAPFTAVNKTYSEIRNSLPAYCKPCIIRSIIKDNSKIFNISFKENSVRFEIIDKYDCKKQKAELYNSYICMFTDFINEFNTSISFVNSDNYIPKKYASFFNLDSERYPSDMTGSYCMMHIKDYEIEDMAQLSMQYSCMNVIDALSHIYRDYFLKEKEVNNLGALIRTIILSNINQKYKDHSSASDYTAA